MRLNRFLAQTGLGARRKVEALVRGGRVSVNGRVEREPATEIDPGEDRVEVDGNLVRPERKRYILLNKPKGVLSAASDARGRRTVLDLVGIRERVFPVGRLDKESRGLLLLTNDGDLMERLLHPKNKVKKVYEVTVKSRLGQEKERRFREGLKLDGRMTAPAEIRFLKQTGEFNVYEVTLGEGRKRQIRRMFELLGLEVRELARTRVGPVEIGTLKEGEWRHLTEVELSKLRQD